ncbi:uncharacterized protein [Diabrotica undecimpunctata]|uniref:uncharacterized protein n=1 Tax=Diabrotica undecimpunctata TaxID=50387 RepID=UPI003B631DE7
MEALKKQRATAKSALTRAYNWCDQFLHSQLTITELQLREESIIKHFERYNVIQDNIEQATDDADALENRDLMEKHYFKYLTLLREKCKSLVESNLPSLTTQTPTVTQTTPTNVKLPQLSLQIFSGNYDKWISFYQLFTSLIIDNPSLTNIQRFIYLKSSLKNEALALIDSLELTHENFTIALDLLEKRYSNNLNIINAHLKSILDYPTLTKVNAQTLRDFVTTIRKHIQSLKNLNIPVDTWDIILVYILSRKIDYNSKKQYGEKRIKSDLPTLDEFLDILEDRCNLLGDLSDSRDYKTEKPSPKFSRTTSLHTNVTYNNSSTSKCIYCNDFSHKIYRCPRFSSLPHSDKLNFTHSQHMCTNCLGTGHSYNECISKTCSICSKKHHTLLHVRKTHNTNFSHPSHNPGTSQGQRTTYPQGNQHNWRSNSNQTHSDANSRKHNYHQTQEKSNPNLNSYKNHTEFDDKPSSSGNNIHPESVTAVSLDTTGDLTFSAKPCNVLLATIKISIQSKSGHMITAKALLDNASQSSFISRNLFEKISCKTLQQPLQISGIAQSSIMSNIMANLTIFSTNNKSNKLNMSCYVLDRITTPLPQTHIPLELLEIPHNISLADSEFFSTSSIDILIGADKYYELITDGIVRLGKNLPVLQNTFFGWIVAGSVPHNHLQNKRVSLFTQTSNVISENTSSLNSLLPKFWEMEEIPTKKLLTPTEEIAELDFKKNFKILETGRFQVNLPIKCPSEHTKLGDSFHIAKKRFEGLEKKFQLNHSLFLEYKRFIDEYITFNHARYIPLTLYNNLSEHKYFLPHHCVIKESSTSTRLRVVFDGSCKSSSGTSLNDIMLTGPQVQPDLFDIICRFRIPQFVCTADIQKMYRQIIINPNQTFLQNILWRDDPSKPLECIELTSVTYGLRSSSFLSTRAIKELAFTNIQKYPLACEALLTQTYVDDILCGAETEADLETTYHELNTVLGSACISTHKWVSNSTRFTKKYCNNDQPTSYDIQIENASNKVLGLSWNPSPDTLSISVPEAPTNTCVTKGIALSTLAKMYDPLGLITPVILHGRLFIKKLFLERMDWDDILPPSLEKEWTTFVNSIPHLKSLKIPRCLFLNKKVAHIQIYGFADSSERAYAACIYFRTVYSDNTVSCILVTGKSRLSPIRTTTLPRLELCAMLLLSKLTKRIISIYENKLSFSSVNLWSDSRIALSWIQSHTSRWNTFVSNRVAQITELTNAFQWRHIKSAENAADYPSRGLLAQNILKLDLWWSGPSFLQDPNLNLAHFNEKINECNLPEERKISLITTKPTEENFWHKIFLRFSKFSRLVHAMAYVHRFIHNSRFPTKTLTGPLSVDELLTSTNSICKIVQHQHFSSEISEIQNSKSLSNKNMVSLSPFINHYDFLCIGGRLKNADILEYHKHPILLPSKSHVVTLLLSHEHTRLGHV